MILRIAIVDENRDYISRMLNTLGEYENLTLSVFTEQAALEQALLYQKFDVLLFNPDIYDGHMDGEKKFVPVVLLDEERGIQAQFQDYRKIRKYQRISKIYQQILEVYAEVCGDTGAVTGQAKTKVIAFYSPCGGAGKTTMALCAAAKYAVQGYRCLYLSLEDVASESCFLPQTGDKGISEIAASLGENINFTMKIQSLLQTRQDNLFYLNHFGSPNDVYELSVEEVKEMVQLFGNTGLFDVVVLDMMSVLDAKALAVFELADSIALIERGDEISNIKVGRFLEQAHIKNAYGKKMRRVLNFYRGKESQVKSDVPVIGRVNAMQNPVPAQFIAVTVQDGSSNCFLQLLG